MGTKEALERGRLAEVEAKEQLGQQSGVKGMNKAEIEDKVKTSEKTEMEVEQFENVRGMKRA